MGESEAEAQARREAWQQKQLDTLSENTMQAFERFPSLKKHYLSLQPKISAHGSGDDYISLFKKSYTDMPGDFGTPEQAVAILNDMVRRQEELSDEDWEGAAEEKEARVSQMSSEAQQVLRENVLLVHELFTDEDASNLRQEAEWLAPFVAEKYGGAEKWEEIISEIEKYVGELE